MEMWVQVKFRAVASGGVFRCRWGPVPLQVLKNRPTCDGKLMQNTKNVAGQPKNGDLRRFSQQPATLLSLTCNDTRSVVGGAPYRCR